MQCHLRNGRDYSSHNFSSDEKRNVVKWMLQEGLGPIQMTRRCPTISKNTFCKWRIKERKGLKQCESRKERPKILDNEAFAEFRDQYDGTKDICKLRVLFNESASKSANRSGKCVVGETFIPSASSLIGTQPRFLVGPTFKISRRCI